MTGWNRPAVWRAVVATATVGLIGLAGGRADGADLRPGAFTGGVSGGFLGDTPDAEVFPPEDTGPPPDVSLEFGDIVVPTTVSPLPVGVL